MNTVRFPSPGFNSARAFALMQQHRLDAVLLTSAENVYYTTGFPAIPSAGNPILYALRNVLPYFAWIRPGKVTLMCWGGAAAGVAFDAQEVITFADAGEAVEKLVHLLREQRASVACVGIESSCPFDTYRLVAEIFNGGKEHRLKQIVLADGWLHELRLVKSPTEIEYLKKSTAIVEQTVGELMDLLHIGISRPELIYQAKYRMLKNGATGVGHVTINFGDSNPEVEIDEQLQENKLVVLDLGALFKGYASDNRRLLYSGPVPQGILDLHATMCAIVDEVAAAICPGITFDELYHLAIGLYQKNRLDPFIPNVGHTIGLNTEELWIYKDSPTVVQAGMVLNLELYSLYSSGELIGDEETYVVDDRGAQRLTSLPRSIRPLA